MKRLLAMILVAFLCSAMFQPEDASARVDYYNGFGVPRGFLDVTVNSMFSLRTGFLPRTSLQLMIQTSFGTKQDGRGGGRLSLWANSAYILARFDFPRPHRKVSPHLALGYGQHLLYSFASPSSLVSKNITTWSGKGHAFIGFDVSLKPKLFLTLWGRVTAPSDKLIDSGYLTLGLRLM